ncbi:MAG: SDR family NAD(P)-dependent oxidoreductase [Halococcoides sp.]
MNTTCEASDAVVLITGVGGALGSAVAESFLDAGATVCGVDVRGPDDEGFLLDRPERIAFYQGDLTDEDRVASIVEAVVEAHGRLDALAAIAGTWAGGTPVAETDLSTIETLFEVNLTTTFLAAKHCLSALRETSGAIVTVSSESSLSGGSGDGPYRATKAGVRLLTESIAAEEDAVRANTILPTVIDTPANRAAMPDADRSEWVAPAAIADVVVALCTDTFEPTTGAAIPVGRSPSR